MAQVHRYLASRLSWTPVPHPSPCDRDVEAAVEPIEPVVAYVVVTKDFARQHTVLQSDLEKISPFLSTLSSCIKILLYCVSCVSCAQNPHFGSNLAPHISEKKWRAGLGFCKCRVFKVFFFSSKIYFFPLHNPFLDSLLKAQT